MIIADDLAKDSVDDSAESSTVLAAGLAYWLDK